ncbi:MAG: cold-shock protein [Elusimicrobia bacterium]|nr:cold-shock protein [Elusimicrobiota bacterium]
MRGVVLRFIDLKGFGFIRPGDGSEDLYVHFSEIERSGFQTLHEGEEVEFEIRRTPHGPVAARVIVLQNRG